MNLNLNINKIFALLFCIGFIFTNVYAENDVYLSLSGSLNRASIGLSEFVPKNGLFEEMNMSRDFKDTLENDLILSRHFNVAVANSSYKFDMDSQFSYWSEKGVSVLLTGTISIKEQTKLVVEVGFKLDKDLHFKNILDIDVTLLVSKLSIFKEFKDSQ